MPQPLSLHPEKKKSPAVRRPSRIATLPSQTAGPARSHSPTLSSQSRVEPIGQPDPESQQQFAIVSDAKRRAYGLRPMINCLIVTDIIVLLSLFFFVAVVFLGFTFTFDPQFSQDTVPFYTDPASGSLRRHASRYTLWWWLLALTLLRFFSIIGTFKAITVASLNGSVVFMSVMRGWIIVYGFIIEGILTVFYLIIRYHQGGCASVPFCRSWDAQPADTAEVAGIANWYFDLMTWYSVVFIAVHIFYFVQLGNAAVNVAKAKAKDEEMKGEGF